MVPNFILSRVRQLDNPHVTSVRLGRPCFVFETIILTVSLA